MNFQNKRSKPNHAAADAQYRFLAKGCIHLEDGSICITDEADAHRFIDSLEHMAHRIADGDDEPIKREQTRLGERFRLTRIGADVWALCKRYDPLMKDRYAQQIFSPHITVALRAFQRWAKILNCARTRDDLDLRLDWARTGLERMVHFIRRVCRSKRFKYLANNSERNAAGAFERCMRYMSHLFRGNSRLLILRVDLYYKSDEKDWGYTLAADKGLDKFLRALREKRIVPDVLGHICKRENGYRRGMHYHLLVALDGHKHREGISRCA